VRHPLYWHHRCAPILCYLCVVCCVYTKQADCAGFLAPEVAAVSSQSTAADMWAAGILFADLLREHVPCLHSFRLTDRDLYRAYPLTLALRAALPVGDDNRHACCSYFISLTSIACCMLQQRWCAPCSRTSRQIEHHQQQLWSCSIGP